MISGTATLGRMRAGRLQNLACPSVPAFTEAQVDRQSIRVVRRSRRVEVDLQDDGVSDLVCTFETPRAGHLGVGVVTQEVIFQEVAIRRL